MASTATAYPFKSLFVDFAGPMRPSNNFRRVVLDHLSHFLGLFPTKDTTASSAAKAIWSYITWSAWCS